MHAIGYDEVNMRLYALKWKDVQNILNKNNQAAEWYVSHRNILSLKECPGVPVNIHPFTQI